MTPEEYKQAADLFDKVRELPEADQAAAVEASCAGNDGLREHVHRLLKADKQALNSSFLGGLALDHAARLLATDSAAGKMPVPGTAIGNYRLGPRIGEGGMGVVYQAEDLRLARRVAVKILPPQTLGTGQNELIQRFVREARAASLLNHPHIISIFDAGFDQGVYYIAMEFVEGRTLRAIIAEDSKTIENKTVLELLSQTASALGAAHEAGIVHRDIKPENIMVRPDGFVKVLDFGLASVRETMGGSSDLRTRPGHLAGTIQYLSPEQVLGKQASARSDLFSLGVVAYELATGVRPFDGSTDGAIFDAILHQKPVPLSSIRPALGNELDGMVEQLLEKDPDLRFQTASDLRSCCKRLSRDSSRPELPKALVTERQRHLRMAAVLSIGALAGAATVWFAGQLQKPKEPLPFEFQKLTDSAGEANFPSFTSDGKQFVYASPRSGNWDIYLQRTGGSAYINLTHDCAQDDTQPAISADGSHIAFRSERDGGGLYVMESTGENPRRVAAHGYLPTWAPDGRRLIYSTHNFISPGQVPRPPSSLFVINLDDNSETPIRTGDAFEPKWSPHGYRIAYWGLSSGGRRDIFTVSARGQEAPLAVTEDPALDWNPVWAPSGRELYFLSDRGGTMNIWRVGIDERSGRVFGPPEPVTVPARSVGSLAMSGDGKALIYSESSQHFNLGRIAYDAARQTALGTVQALGEGHTVLNFSFSPDGSRLVYDTIGDTTENLWIMNADGSGRRRLTSDGYRNRGPQWSPKGNEILFYSDRLGHYDDWVIGADGSGLRPLTNGPKLDMQGGTWSPDGKRVLAGRFGQSIELDSQRQTAITTVEEAVALHPDGVFCSAWTVGPDGNLAACDFATTDSGYVTKPSGYELAVYSPKDRKLERSGLKAMSSVWAPAANRKEVHRRLLFADGTGCFLYDRTKKTVVRVFSAAPNTVLALAPSPNGKFIYVSQRIRDADLWLARIAK